MKFVLDMFPLVVAVGGLEYSEAEFKEMEDGFDALFARGDRYAVINYTPEGGSLPSARDRKRIADWAESPRVRESSKKLCVGSATVVQSALTRGALTAIMWLWKPATPHKTVSSPTEAIEYCLDQLAAANVRMPHDRDQVFATLGKKAFGNVR